MENLKLELKEKLIENLNLEDIEISDIGDDDSLFGDGLGLDSIDVLELIVMLDKDYGIWQISASNSPEGQNVYYSVQVKLVFDEDTNPIGFKCSRGETHQLIQSGLVRDDLVDALKELHPSDSL